MTIRAGWPKWALVMAVLGGFFWLASLVASTIPRLVVLQTSVHGLSLSNYESGSILGLAPLSPRIVQDALRDAIVPTPAPSVTTKPVAATPEPTVRPASSPTAAVSPSPTAGVSPSPTAGPSPSPSILPLPSIVPTPTPTPTPTSTPTPTPACSGAATISGQVADIVTKLGIPKASVTMSACGLPTTTDINGNFSFSNLPAGQYTVTASATGYYSNSQAVTVSGGQTIRPTIFLTSVTATGGLKGQVTDSATLLPLVGATVSIDGLTTVTDVNGSYTLPVIPFGTWTATVSALNYRTQGLQVTIKPGKTTVLNVALIHQ